MAVPTVDLSGDIDLVARRIDAACRDVGFFQIVGHGIGPDRGRGVGRSTRLLRAAARGQAGPRDPPGDAYGYGPFKIERLAASLGEPPRPI